MISTDNDWIECCPICNSPFRKKVENVILASFDKTTIDYIIVFWCGSVFQSNNKSIWDAIEQCPNSFSQALELRKKLEGR